MYSHKISTLNRIVDIPKSWYYSLHGCEILLFIDCRPEILFYIYRRPKSVNILSSTKINFQISITPRFQNRNALPPLLENFTFASYTSWKFRRSLVHRFKFQQPSIPRAQNLNAASPTHPKLQRPPTHRPKICDPHRGELTCRKLHVKGRHRLPICSSRFGTVERQRGPRNEQTADLARRFPHLRAAFVTAQPQLHPRSSCDAIWEPPEDVFVLLTGGTARPRGWEAKGWPGSPHLNAGAGFLVVVQRYAPRIPWLRLPGWATSAPVDDEILPRNHLLPRNPIETRNTATPRHNSGGHLLLRPFKSSLQLRSCSPFLAANFLTRLGLFDDR